jgi:hypothetical protein
LTSGIDRAPGSLSCYWRHYSIFVRGIDPFQIWSKVVVGIAMFLALFIVLGLLASASAPSAPSN